MSASTSLTDVLAAHRAVISEASRAAVKTVSSAQAHISRLDRTWRGGVSEYVVTLVDGRLYDVARNRSGEVDVWACTKGCLAQGRLLSVGPTWMRIRDLVDNAFPPV